ncbi:MAG: MFS transporter [Desulfobulbaceae bacterium]|jgi:DHA2 family multidrug resistance protein|nr:MFS transporter [Desulfobulbaceae bacterium]
MNPRIDSPNMRENTVVYLLLVGGILLAGLAEAFTGTALSFGRLDMWGDLYTTSDEFAWLDVSYTSAKLCGFMMVPALFARFRPIRVLLTASAVMTVVSVCMTCTANLYPLVFFRVAQGAAGGILLVGGQTLLFTVFGGKWQPLTQLLFACGAVVVPATFAASLQGWMVDVLTWEAIFLFAAALGMTSLIVLAFIPLRIMCKSGTKRFDAAGFTFFAVAAFCLTYIAQEGSRWNWFETRHIAILTVFGFAALLACILRWIAFPRPNSLVNLSVFDNRDFCFGFAVSFVAGVALFGSTWLIPGFTLNVLGLTATEAGALIAPGGVMFFVALSLTALLLSFSRVHPLATVPLGIFLIMAGMWMLSGSTSESGSADLLIPLMIRGTGLGFLFLSLTIYALGGLQGSQIAQGVALFTTFRQFGGLFGVGVLQRYLDHQNAQNGAVLSSHLEAGGVLLTERLHSVQAALQSRGMEAGDAAKAAMAFLQKSLTMQSNTISYNEAFFVIVIVFLIAAPLLVLLKIWLSKRHTAHITAY